MTRTQFIQQAVLLQLQVAVEGTAPPSGSQVPAVSLGDMQRMLEVATGLAGVLETIHEECSVDDVVGELRELDKSLQLIANELPNASRGS